MPIVEALKWPVVVIVLAIVFRGNIGKLIDRIRGFGPKGFDASAGGSAQIPQAPPSTEPVPSLAAAQADVLQPFTNPLELRVEQQFLATIATFSGQDREKYLLRASVRSAIQVHFERTFWAIYRSQLDALAFLNTASKAIPRELLKTWYDGAAQKNPMLYATYTFEQWLDFMATAYLVNVTADSVSITIDGKEFLKFIIDRGYATFFKQN